MSKITFIGAGSVVFTRNLSNDILLTPALQDGVITLMDIDPDRLAQARELVQTLVDQRGLKTQVEATTDQREAVTGADYVITTFQQGGLDAYKLDIEIPAKYGVGQCVGDTLGPGGIFRSLRTIPVLIDLAHDLDEVAPDALVINYVNPMAANSWAFDELTGRPYVGLCHSVQGTSEMLARWCDVSYDEINFLCAGINHQSWFLEFRRGNEDLYPKIWEAIEKPEIYKSEPVRIEMMKYFGCFVTESSGHASEYVPYFRKDAEMIEEELVSLFDNDKDGWFDFGRTGGYYRHCVERLANTQKEYAELLAGTKTLPAERSHEYGVQIMDAIETNKPIRINGNVPNSDLIDNLPTGCSVEVPCLVDGTGIQPIKVGWLPEQLAALNRTNINVQALIVEAARTGDVEPVYHAAMLDPLTATVCTLPEIASMIDEMLEAEKQWLPLFDLA